MAQLRPNTPFKLLVPQTPEETEDLAGSFHFHVEIIFEDGEEWLARIAKSRQGDGPIDMLRNSTESEVLTYQLLLSHGIPVPAVHDWGAGEFSKTNGKSLHNSKMDLADPIRSFTTTHHL